MDIQRPYGVQPQKLDIAEIIKESFSIFFSQIFKFLAISFINFLPLVLFGAFAVFFVQSHGGVSELKAIQTEMILFFLGGILGFCICGYMNTAAITYGVFQHLRKKQPSVIQSVQKGFASLLPVLGVVFFSMLAIAGGALLFIIPGIIIFFMLYVAIPTVVVENTGVFEALKKSRELTYGFKGYIFGLTFFLGIIQNILSKVIEIVLAQPGLEMIYAFTIFFMMFCFSCVGSVACVVVYYNLRKIKENIEVKEILRVFD